MTELMRRVEVLMNTIERAESIAKSIDITARKVDIEYVEAQLKLALEQIEFLKQWASSTGR